jgi:hypothetical protein
VGGCLAERSGIEGDSGTLCRVGSGGRRVGGARY